MAWALNMHIPLRAVMLIDPCEAPLPEDNQTDHSLTIFSGPTDKVQHTIALLLIPVTTVVADHLMAAVMALSDLDPQIVVSLKTVHTLPISGMTHLSIPMDAHP